MSAAPYSLLSRFAGNVYWLARYLERAENLARILGITEAFARTDTGGADWHRVVELYADMEAFDKLHANDYDDAQAVINFYLLDRKNPSSAHYAVEAARENARSVRHLISTEMWQHLNIFYNWFNSLDGRSARTTTLARICADIRHACQTFEGIAEGTFFRGESWSFYLLGKYLERMDQTTRILDMGFTRLFAPAGADGDEALVPVQWQVLLRSVAGYHAFRSRFPARWQAQDIASFLLYDREFPRAAALCLDRMTERLQVISGYHDARRAGRGRAIGPEKARRELQFTLETGLGSRINTGSLHKFLDKLQQDVGSVSDAISKSYFK